MEWCRKGWYVVGHDSEDSEDSEGSDREGVESEVGNWMLGKSFWRRSVYFLIRCFEE